MKEAVQHMDRIYQERVEALIEAAKLLFDGYTAEDQNPKWWKTDDRIDHRLYALFVTVEALEEVERD